MRVLRLTSAALLVTALLSFVVACQKKAAAPPPQAGGAASESLNAAAAPAAPPAGQQEYLAYCAMCHGNDGNGDGEAADRLAKSGVVVAKLTNASRVDSLGRSGVRQVIAKGGSHTGRSNVMPSWGHRLSPQTLDAITDYVMTLPARNPELRDQELQQYLAAPAGTSGQGRVLFVHNCSVCHGPYGKGDGPLGVTLAKERDIHPRDLTDSTYFAGLDDKRIYTAIMLGGGHVHRSAYMPMWAVKLDPAQVKDLVSYIRAISRTPSKP